MPVFGLIAGTDHINLDYSPLSPQAAILAVKKTGARADLTGTDPVLMRIMLSFPHEREINLTFVYYCPISEAIALRRICWPSSVRLNSPQVGGSCVPFVYAKRGAAGT